MSTQTDPMESIMMLIDIQFEQQERLTKQGYELAKAHQVIEYLLATYVPKQITYSEILNEALHNTNLATITDWLVKKAELKKMNQAES